ncbi:MAG: TonB-dependent receptor [Prolixibacteraceae bacterium]|nr:TonB-dependent receptor [Prolixibacteraceae bacterium]
MKKNHYGLISGVCKIWKSKFFKKMRIVTLLILISITQTFALDTYAQNKRLNLNAENEAIVNILEEIERQSEFYFMFDASRINVNQRKTVDCENQPIRNILDQLFEDTGITYSINDRQVLLTTTDKSDIEQQKAVSGKVIDSKGQSLPGVTVVVKGTTHGTVTNTDGEYSIANISANATLVFSFVGMKTQEVEVAGSVSINIVMEEDAIGIEEVVAVGYGTQRRVEVTGSVSSVKGDDLQVVKNTDLRNSMQGRLPGVRIKQQSSEPGSYETVMDIRGLGSPLVVVDGVPRDDFQKIDPNEIESISVLKDASAAIYGVRAANGVVLITTKKGISGKTKVTLDASYGWDKIANFADVCNAGQYAELINEALVNAGQSPRYSQEEISKYYLGNDPAYPNQDWVDALLKESAPQQSYKIGINGGSEKIQYYIGGSYLDQQGLFESGDLWYKKYNLRSNITAQIAKDLSAEVLISGIHDNKHAPGFGSMWGAFKAAYMMEPIYSLYANNNPEYLNAIGPNQPIGNVIGDTYEKWKGYQSSYNDQLYTNVSVTYNIPFVKGLKVKGLLAYDINSFDSKQFSKPIQTYYYDEYDDAYVPATALGKSNVTEDFSKTIKPLQQLSLEYKNRFKDHNISALLLFEQQKTQFKRLWGGRFINLPIDQLTAGNIDLSQNVDASEYNLANRGLVGKVGYDYKSKYLVNASFRYDGSSKFAPDSRWGFFPSISAGWRMSEENFIKDNLTFIDELKVRFSYGKLGDDQAADSYPWVTGYNYPSSSYIIGGSDPTSGIGFRGAINPYITWYTSKMKNIGFESVLWNNQLNVEFDLFRRDRDGLLGYRNLSLPSTIGVGLPQENLNSDQTSGFELVLGTQNKIGDFWYSVSANLTYSQSKNEYIERSPSNNSYLNWRQNGQDRYSDIWWGYKCIGQFESFEEIQSSPIQDNQGNKSLLPGDLKYEDLSGDGIIDDNDVQPIGRGQSGGNNIPPYNFGLDISMKMKGFDCSILLQGAVGHRFYLGEQWQEPLRSGKNNVYMAEFDRWHQADPNDPNSEWVPGKFPSTRFGGASNNRFTSDFWLKDGDYLRLKSVELGYTLPENWTQLKGVSSIRIYANAFNIFTFTKERDLKNILDPESRGDYLWGYNYPINKSFNLGINLTF